MDVELCRRLFHHLFRLPLVYFETRAAGQTVARMRELETIRGFLTGQGLTSLLDLVFTLVFFLVMFIYSPTLTLVVLASVPVWGSTANESDTGLGPPFGLVGAVYENSFVLSSAGGDS